MRRLRVVDASIFPLMPRAGLQGLVHVVIELVVEFAQEGWECTRECQLQSEY